MIYPNDVRLKIELIDQAFTAISVEHLTQLIGETAVINKLTGNIYEGGFVSKALSELASVSTELEHTRAECISLKEDLRTMIRCLGQNVRDPCSTHEFVSLKIKHNIY